MRPILLLILLLALLSPRPARAQQADLAPILNNLASPDFATRQAAQKQLDAIPPEQYDMLAQLAAIQNDAEVKARLQTRAQDMLRQLLATQAASPLRMSAHLSGRVVDPAGIPIAGAFIRATSPAWGDQLAQCLEQKTTTGADGRFDLPLPFPELLYQFMVLGRGFSDAPNLSVIVHEHTNVGDITLTPTAPVSVAGTLLDQNGKPVPRQKIEILGEEGSGGTAITDAAGGFSANNLSTSAGYIGQAIPIVHRDDGLTVPIDIVRPPAMANLQLKLVPAAAVSGRIYATSGQPLPGATVFLRPFFVSAMLLTTATADDGSYRFTNVPPGEFILTAEAPGFMRAAPHTVETRLPRLTLKSGEAASRDLTLEPMAILRGTVRDRTGQPVPDALVGIISNWRNDYVQQWCAVQTDAAGRYIIATGHTVERTNPSPDTRLIAFSATQGMIITPVPKLTVGELREVNVALPGSVHLTGTLVDSAGHGIPSIQCRTNATQYMAVTSAADGAFDFGRISLPADPLPLQLQLTAPRPGAAEPSAPFNTAAPPPAFRQITDAPTFYAHQDVTIKPEEAARQTFTLKPVKLFQFQGTVVKPDGTPAANAEVYILTGDANPATWVESARPMPIASSRMPIIRDRALAAGKADKEGHFNLFAVREEGNAAILEASKWDYAHFKIGAWLTGQSTLTDKIDMTTDSKSDLKITLDH